MKILCFTDSLGSGGAQRQLVNLAIGFKEKGHEVSFLVYHDESFFKPILEEVKIPITLILEKNYFPRILKIRSFIRNGNFDAVLSFLEGANFIAELSSLPHRKWKLVVGERSANPNLLKSYKLIAYRWFHFLANHVVANSQENIKLVKKCNPLLPQNKFKVIYNKVDLNKWKPNNDEVLETNKTFKLLILANHQPLKNAMGLLEAISLIPDDHKKKLTVHWYGRQDSYEVKESFVNAKDFVEAAKLNKIIQFFPPSSDVHEVIHQYDALGLFSFYEGFPNTICEGMASGKPIIASAVSDVPVFIEEGINGFLCNPNDTQSIANALIKAIETPKEQLYEMGLRNRAKAEILFSENETVVKYLNLLKK